MAIAYPKIGSVEFIELGELMPVIQGSRVVTRANVDGVAIQKGALRGEPQRLVGTVDIDCADADELQTKINEFVAMAGQSFTITTNGGVERENIYVQSVRIPLRTRRGRQNPHVIKTPVGGTLHPPADPATHLIEVHFDVIDTNTAVTTP